MAERTAIWKYDRTGDIFTEFDFLAVLDFCAETCDHDCGGCAGFKNMCFNMLTVKRIYDENEISAMDYFVNREKVDALFWREINSCLVSNCDCAALVFDKRYPWECVSYRITRAESETRSQYGCDDCVVEMRTGTLKINDSVSVDRSHGDAPTNCSIPFLWRSKAQSVLAPDRVFPGSASPNNTLPVYVDFLPALEVFKRTPGGDKHECFIVPKSCGVCDRWESWRKSRCIAEIAIVVNKMSAEHKKCYKIIKYILSRVDDPHHPVISWYLVKTIALNHSKTCSDLSDDYAECVLEMLQDLLHAFEKKALESDNLGIDIFGKLMRPRQYKGNKIILQKCIKGLYSVTDADSWNAFEQTIANALKDELKACVIS